MLKAKKGNRVLRIPDEKAKEYKALGYSVYTMDGKTIYENVNPEEQMRKLQAENDALRAENEELKAKLEPTAAKPAKEAPNAAAKAAVKPEAKTSAE